MYVYMSATYDMCRLWAVICMYTCLLPMTCVDYYDMCRLWAVICMYTCLLPVTCVDYHLYTHVCFIVIFD